MKALVLKQIASLEDNPAPLDLVDLPMPSPVDNEVLIEVFACGVYHTELDIIEGRTPPVRLPITIGHQVVGRVKSSGRQANRFQVNERVGIGWIYSACGHCSYCWSGLENLCQYFKATGKDANGGYAQYMTVSEDFVYRLPAIFSDVEAVPLLGIGAMGYRSLRLAELQDGQKLGFIGFDASAQLLMRAIKQQYPRTAVFVFSRNEDKRALAKELGATWVGDFTDEPPEKMACIIDSTLHWQSVIDALEYLRPGGRLVINAAHKQERDQDSLRQLDYGRHLGMEKVIKRVTNISRSDVAEFLAWAARFSVKPAVEVYPMEEANQALLELSRGEIRAVKVLRMH
ncbi:MAG: alcohol dehydrogenase catalytic domain-containing protein [Bacteroidota bacterium]